MAQAIRVQEATRESKEKEIPLMEKIRRYSEAIPECELANIPSDLSENHGPLHIWRAQKVRGREVVIHARSIRRFFLLDSSLLPRDQWHEQALAS